MVELCFVYTSSITADQEFAALPVRRMTDVLDSDTFNVHVLYSGELATDDLEAAGVTCHTIDLPDNLTGRYKRLYNRVQDLETREDIDVFSNVWAHYDMLPVIAATNNAATALRLVGDPMGISTPDKPIDYVKKAAGRSLEQLCLSQCDIAYANSETVKQQLETILNAHKIEVVSQGVDVEQFTPGQTQPSNQFLFVGRKTDAKGLPSLVDAFTDLEQDAELVIAGPGTAPESTQETIESHPRITDLGFVPNDELVDVYQESLAVVLPSESESLPNVVLEAQATGTPIIVSDAGDMPRVASEGGGMVIERDRPESLRRAMATLLEQPDTAAAMGDAGREYVEQSHSFETVNARLTHVLARQQTRVDLFNRTNPAWR